MNANPPLTMSFSGPRWRIPAAAPESQNHIYGVPALFQVTPTEVASITNIRVISSAQDYENGADAFIFDSLDHAGNAKAVSLVRNEEVDDPDNGRRMVMVVHAPNGGFVPLGARLPDGRPHPAAGTGFGVSVATPHTERATCGVGPAYPKSYLRDYLLLLQFRYDGREFKVVSCTPLSQEDFFPDWITLNRGFGVAIPDGEDLLFGMVAGQERDIVWEHRRRVAQAGRLEHPRAHEILGECYGSVVSRWKFGPKGWYPVSYVSVPGIGPDMSAEPTLVRDRDGSILFSVRGRGFNSAPGQSDEGLENTYEHFRVYRSLDGGATWERVIHLAKMRSPSPVVVNVLRNGEPYLAANPYTNILLDDKGRRIYRTRIREELMAWPLTPDRRGVKDPVLLLDGRERFGQAVQHDTMDHINQWYIDHPQGAVVRLADGQWHSLLGFRLTDTALSGYGIMPPEMAGAWIEEVSCPGESAAAWSFDE